jgi:hypothetical protein
MGLLRSNCANKTSAQKTDDDGANSREIEATHATTAQEKDEERQNIFKKQVQHREASTAILPLGR